MKLLISTLAALTLLSANALAADPVAGEKVFAKCKVCHAIGEEAKNKVGPQLNGIEGRKMASIADFKGYAADLKKMGEDGGVWTAANLAVYLKDPKAFNPGTKMAFAGIKDEGELADVVAYLLQFGPTGAKK